MRLLCLSLPTCILATAALVAVPGCTRKAPPESTVTPELAAATHTEDPMAVLDELEALVDAQSDSEDDRVFAYDRVSKIADDATPGWAFARAATAGRLAELRGAGAGKLVTEAETFARLSVERDPTFRDAAARRMLGTLYVMAPPRLVEHGDAEVGLEMLEALANEAPNDPRNQLRLCEAFINLGDPEPALAGLCAVTSMRGKLRPDDQRLLDALIDEVGGAATLDCIEASA